MKKTQVIAGLGLAGAALTLWEQGRRRLALNKGPATGLLPDGRPGTALITGGSSGIGAEFARRLAAQGYDLVLVARHQDRLTVLATELAGQHGVSVETLAADLAQPAGIAEVERYIQGLGRLTLLVNNAGFGTTGRFGKIDPERHQEMVNLHVLAPTRLARAALPGMVSRRQGGIINVASLGAFVPLTGGVNYSATKAYLVMFSRGLANECKNRNIRVQALCPGFTYTSFHDTPEFHEDSRSQIPRFMWGPVGPVVEESLACLALGRVVCVPRFINQVAVVFLRDLPTAVLVDTALSQGLIRR